MTGHLKREQIQHFIDRQVDTGSLLDYDEHLASCEVCGAEMQAILRESVEGQRLEADAESADHLEYDVLSAYVDGEIDDVGREIVEVHTEDCGDCAQFVMELRQLRVQLIKDEAPVERVSWLGGWLARLLVPAAAVLLLVALGWFLFALDRSTIESAGVTVLVEDLPIPDEIANDSNVLPNSNGTTANNKVIADPLNDGGGVVGLDANGELAGVALPGELAVELKRVLKGGDVEIPTAAKGLASSRGVLMGDGQGVPFSLKSPVGKAIESDRPTFVWEPLKDAESYEISVFDDQFNKVVSSVKIPTTSWKPPSPLARGRVYQWQVTAIKDGIETRSPVRPAPDARFLVIGADAAAAIRRARAVQPRSNLVLGIAYAEAGMLEEARTEFSALARRNPNSTTAKRLLRSVR